MKKTFCGRCKLQKEVRVLVEDKELNFCGRNHRECPNQEAYLLVKNTYKELLKLNERLS